MTREPIDIIVPIYNAYEDLKHCVKSVKKYTDLTFDRLILINDCSPDERVALYLETVESDNIVVINNEKNLGFSGNVNLGMQMSEERDVVLLNSDTIVTKNWLNKIAKCAYSADEIGTVTPLSNAATLCSVPDMCVDNKIPENVTIDEFAEIIEKCSYKAYPRITVAVGFCMFIKRRVIQETGLFDAETFERGYGEENDFCNRAEQLGYIHVMCDDTFIYHRGTVSFISEEKQKLIDAHDKILQERYPVQMRNNHLYCVNNPDQYIRDNIKLFLKLKNGKKNLLYVIHSDFREDAPDHVGGTQFHVRDLVNSLRDKYNLFVAARVNGTLRLSIYLESGCETFSYDVGEKPVFPQFRDRKQRDAYHDILTRYSIDIVHVHHTQGMSFEVFYEASKLQIPVYLTLHDYYYICPNEKLVGPCGKYCMDQNDKDCAICLKNKFGIVGSVDYLPKWRTECRKIFKICSKLITPSKSARDIYLSIYPELEDKIKVVPHGCEFEPVQKKSFPDDIQINEKVHVCFDNAFNYNYNPDMISGWAYIEDVNAEKCNVYLHVEDEKGCVNIYSTQKESRVDVAEAFGNELYASSGFCTNIIGANFTGKKLRIRLVIEENNHYYMSGTDLEVDNNLRAINPKKKNVAFIGGMAEAKGSKVACEVISEMKKEVNWFVMGSIGDPDLTKLQQDNLYKIGAYEKNELPELFKKHNIDLVCIFSIWPESFCYTISEALMCGVPVLVSKYGAMGERVNENKCGWVVDVNDKQAIVDKIKYVISNKNNEYEEKRANAGLYQEKNLDYMRNMYIEIYGK